MPTLESPLEVWQSRDAMNLLLSIFTGILAVDIVASCLLVNDGTGGQDVV